MGETREWTCECSYTASVSDGPGFACGFRGMTCLDCDVLVSVRWEQPSYATLLYDPYTEEEKAMIGLCPECRGTNLEPMEKRVYCPKCGREMTDNLVMDWD